MYRRILLVALLLIIAIPPPRGVQAHSARVTYVSGSTIYIDAGGEKGLQPGNRLVVMREQEVVAFVEVRDVSSNRAACTVVQQLIEPTVDDQVHFTEETLAGPSTPIPEADDSADATRPGETVSEPGSQGSSTSPGVHPTVPYVGKSDLLERSKRTKKRGQSPLRRAGVRGRIGLRYLYVKDEMDSGSTFSQPALDVKIESRNLNGGPWGGAIDVRSRRSYRGNEDDTSRTRLYRLFLSRRGVDDPWNLTLGRQFSPSFSAVSIFDGISIDFERPRWATGVFTGSQPDPVTYGYSTQVREHGAYFQVRGLPSKRNWRLTTGVVGSYDDSEINREFLFFQGHYNGPKLSIYATQEVDYNRDWKADEGADSLSMTGSFVTVRYQLSQAVNLHGGYDNRRNVRLYRDRVTPITEFDDAYRQGLWGGASFMFGNHFRMGLDGRTNDGGEAGRSDSYTLNLRASRLTSMNMDFRVRGTQYSNLRTEGHLISLDAGIDLGRIAHFSLSGGLREQDSLIRTTSHESIHWYGLDFDFNLGSHWYLMFSGERTDGQFEQVDQFFTTLAYRF